jgi:hypothetical protein
MFLLRARALVGSFTFARSASIIIMDRVLVICVRYFYSMEAGECTVYVALLKSAPALTAGVGSDWRRWIQRDEIPGIVFHLTDTRLLSVEQLNFLVGADQPSPPQLAAVRLKARGRKRSTELKEYVCTVYSGDSERNKQSMRADLS